MIKLEGERDISPRKITDYLLNIEHPDGGGKAKFFLGHGFSTSQPDGLQEAIHFHAETNEIENVVTNAHGTKTVVRCSFPTPDGRNPCIRVVWIQEAGSDLQRLVTAYPAEPGPVL